jgi:hypothetical protein
MLLKMKCINCKGKWTPPPGITVTKCPFCKKPIKPAKTPKTYSNAKDVLCFIAKTYGADALLTKSLFSDIAPMLTDERELIKMFRDKGSLEVLQGALKSPPSEQSVSIKTAIAKLPSYLQNSPEAIALMNDFVEALGWQVEKPVPPQLVNVIPLTQPVHKASQPTQTINPQRTGGGIEVAPKIGNIMRFGKYDWRVLDVQNGQTLLISDKVIEKKRYHTDRVATTWEKCELRGYLNNTFYDSFGQDKLRISESQINNPNNLWYGKNGGSATTDKIFLLSLEEVDKYFGNSGDYANKRRKDYKDGKFVTASDGWAFSNNHNAGRVANYGSEGACLWWLRSPGNYSLTAAYVYDDGRVYVRGGRVDYDSGGVRPALWLNL